MVIREQYRQQVSMLVRILPLVAEQRCFALKGGTAINLFMQPLPRLSVDIDLAFLPIAARDESLRQAHASLQHLAKRIAQVFPNLQVRQQLSREDELRLVVSQPGAQVKIEVSPVLRGTFKPVEWLDVREEVEAEFGAASIQVVSMADLYGGKLCAALDRQHPRDLFDVMLLLHDNGLTREVFEGFLVYLLSHPRPMAELLNPNRKELKQTFAHEFSGMSSIPVSVAMLEDTREEMIRALRRQLRPQDAEFLLSFKQGQPRWSLAGLDENIGSLPAVKWKLQNIAKMSTAKHTAALSKLESVLAEIRQDWGSEA